MSIVLRPYQAECIEQIRQQFRAGKRAPLLILPTGAGKTVCFAFIAQQAALRGNRVGILAHRAELLDQISHALSGFDVPHGFIAAGFPESDQQVMVCSAQTLIRRLGRFAPFDLIVVDEAHHCVAGNTWGKILDAYPQARRLGVTATGRRPSGEPLGAVFDALVLGPTVEALTDQGYLARARLFAPPTVSMGGMHLQAGEFKQADVARVMDKPHVVGDAIDHYRRYAHGKATVCFCYSIEHSRFMARAFRDAGYSAAHLDGNLDRELRRTMVRDFRDGRIQVLCSVDVISEGFDLPGIHCGILLRPTASEVVYLQQVGRCLRTAEGKEAAIILDHARNVERHGLPTDERDWSLEGRIIKRRGKDEAQVSVKICPKCFGAQRAGLPGCRHCGFVFEVQSREVKHIEGELQELTGKQKARRRETGRLRTREELEAYAAEKNYKSGWVDHILSTRRA